MEIFVYRHRRLDNNKVFYIGIGNHYRPHWKYNRSKYWNNVVDKAGLSVEIIQICNSWEDACDLERLLILEYGRKDLGTGCLVNMTEGGEGNTYWLGKERPYITGRPSKPVIQFTKEGYLIKEYKSIREASRNTKARKSHIIAVCKGRAKTAGGYIWKYKNEVNEQDEV